MKNNNELVLEISSSEQRETIKINSLTCYTNKGKIEALVNHEEDNFNFESQNLLITFSDGVYKDLNISSGYLKIIHEANENRTKVQLICFSYNWSSNNDSFNKKLNSYPIAIGRSQTLLETELNSTLTTTEQEIRDIEGKLRKEFENR
jgi:hypothetical protein